MFNLTKRKKSITLIELITAILIVAIIAATTVGVVIFFVQLFIYSPRQMDTQKIGEELAYIMIEGNQDLRGLRYTRNIIDASSTQFSYTYGYPTPSDQLSVRFRWDSGDSHIYRSTSTDAGVTWSVEDVVPYYISAGVTIDGNDTAGIIFTYKKAADADWVFGVDALGDIRRVIVSLSIKTGSGSFNDFQGSSKITSGVEIKDF